MSYRDFTLESIKKKLQLLIHEQADLFANAPELQPGTLLSDTLTYNLPLALAINTEKSRSELIIAPILVELRQQFEQISLVYGTIVLSWAVR
ncbi:MAG: hypothetical protein ACKO24_12645 [Leptolyngbyaceae cyanobacterium]